MSRQEPRAGAAALSEGFAVLEARFVALRAGGVGREEAARRLQLSPTAESRFEDAYRQQTFNASPDSSCPRFAHHDEHVDGALREGGFPIIRNIGRPVLVGPSGGIWRATA